MKLRLRQLPSAEWSLLLLLCLSVLGGCETRVQPNAEERPIVAVYGVLDPDNATHYIRLAKGFLVEGDAVAYAGNTDLSIRNAGVYLTFGNPQRPDTIRFQGVDTVRQTGDFPAEFRVYASNASLAHGQTYKLHVEVEDEPELNVTAETTIPFPVNYFVPADSVRVPGQSLVWDWDVVPFDAEPRIAFQRSGNRNATPTQTGVAFEVRVGFRYGVRQTNGDTLWQPTAVFGPVGPFSQNAGCNLGTAGRDICYRLSSSGFIGFILNRTAQFDGQPLVYDDKRKNRSTYIEVTALNQPLFDYIRVNNPAFQDFTNILPEYTNLEPVQPGSIALGIFAATSRKRTFVNLTPCTRYNLRLNDQQEPVTNCELFRPE